MSKIDELKRVYIDELCASGGDVSAGIAAVVRAVRDEFGRIMYPGDDWNRQGILEQFDQILGDAEAGKVAGGPTREDGRAEGVLVASSGCTPEALVTSATDPAPALCLWRVHHETRNGPLYVSQCDGEWRHATADPRCPSCKKEIFFVTDPAPAVCVWTPQDEGPAHEIWKTACGTMYERAKSTGWCNKCKAPIKFTEAK